MHDSESRAALPKTGAPPAASETGWLPDCVYTGEKFEFGLAFFADALGRIVRFSREPADLSTARRLAGQAALPGIVNTHSHAFHRVVRGRAERRGRADRDPLSSWREVLDRATARLSDEDLFDVARMAFMEMLLSGVTCVGEFHYLHHRPDGSPWAESGFLAQEVMRAARDVGIRIALLDVAWTRGSRGGGPAPARSDTGATDRFLRGTEALRVAVAKNYPVDEGWMGVAPYSLAAVPLDQFKAIAAYAHAQRLRLHTHVSADAEEHAACSAEYGRAPIVLLAEQGILDKRFTAIDAVQLSEDEARLLGTARSTVCVCPGTALNLAIGLAPVDRLLAAGAGVALGTDSQVQIDLLKDARFLEYGLRGIQKRRAAIGADVATTLFHAATVAGARSLGATGGALEVGRPADFFTVNLYDPAIAGADADSLLANIVLGLERRAVREVWIGARQRLANGRHALHGTIVGRFVDVQQRLWAG